MTQNQTVNTGVIGRITGSPQDMLPDGVHFAFHVADLFLQEGMVTGFLDVGIDGRRYPCGQVGVFFVTERIPQLGASAGFVDVLQCF